MLPGSPHRAAIEIDPDFLPSPKDQWEEGIRVRQTFKGRAKSWIGPASETLNAVMKTLKYVVMKTRRHSPCTCRVVWFGSGDFTFVFLNSVFPVWNLVISHLSFWRIWTSSQPRVTARPRANRERLAPGLAVTRSQYVFALRCFPCKNVHFDQTRCLCFACHLKRCFACHFKNVFCVPF